MFHRAYTGGFDLVVAQYHDQGHIPIKLVAFDTAVNVSLGLPIDRTSVDHGTAFDIAGKGIANHGNMNAAIAYARRLAAGRKPDEARDRGRLLRRRHARSTPTASPTSASSPRTAGALLDEGCHGIAMLGTTGEANSFGLHRAHGTSLEAAIEGGIAGRSAAARHRRPLRRRHRRADHATPSSAGAKGVVMLPPYYYKGVSDEGLFRFYARVIEGVGDDRLRVVLYHIPQVDPRPDQPFDLIARLMAAFPGIVCRHQGQLGRRSRTCARMCERFPDLGVLAGADPFMLPLLRHGRRGLHHRHLEPRAPTRCASSGTTGRTRPRPTRSRPRRTRIVAWRKLGNTYVQLPTVKAMLAQRRGDMGWLNLMPPLVELPEAERQAVWAEMDRLGG